MYLFYYRKVSLYPNCITLNKSIKRLTKGTCISPLFIKITARILRVRYDM